MDEKIIWTAEAIKNGKNIKEFKKNLLRIYLRMRKSSEANLKPIDASYEFNKLNQAIAKSRSDVNESTEKLRNSLPKEAHLNFSVQDKKIYWFGFVETKPESYKQVYE